MTFEASLREALEELGVAASEEQFVRLCGHFGILQRWNTRMNLTAVRDPAGIAKRHFGESAVLHRELPPSSSLVDVGSGAGFPGLPVAILRPDTSVTLVESKRRKAAFLREATRDLRNVRVGHCRIADWTGTAEWALMRGVAPSGILPDLARCVSRVAILGTACPPSGAFGCWQQRPTPWSDGGRLWTGEAT